MELGTDLADAADVILATGEVDGAIDAWTLEELEQLADLGSVRSALVGSNDLWH